jgi:hypothetical protein
VVTVCIYRRQKAMELLSAGSVGTEGRLRARTQRRAANGLDHHDSRKDFHKEEDSGWAVAENMRKERAPCEAKAGQSQRG